MKHTEIHCDEVQPLLYLHVGGDLEASQAQRVERHLTHCGTCSQHLQVGLATAKLRAGYWDREVSPAPDLWPALQRAINGDSQGEQPLELKPTELRPLGRKGGAFGARRWQVLATAALVMVATGLAWHLAGQDGTTSNGEVATTNSGGNSAGFEIVGEGAVGTPGPNAFASGEPVTPLGQPETGVLAGALNQEAQSGLRRLHEDEPSLLEQARPWGMEEAPPAGLRFPDNPMRVAGGQ